MNYGAQKCCSFGSGKGELVKIQVWAGNLLALVSKDSVGILRGSCSDGGPLSGAKKLYSSLATGALRFARAAQKVHLRAPSFSSFLQECAQPSESMEVMSKEKMPSEQLQGWGTGVDRG